MSNYNSGCQDATLKKIAKILSLNNGKRTTVEIGSIVGHKRNYISYLLRLGEDILKDVNHKQHNILNQYIMEVNNESSK